eukprot:TRINITY_DN2470_c0_g1_i13.p2 TRINITY_DN2470_c0_g1~~TRINITY_DN2470_c0_g1_i13.p2  ORF type:complete len:145 (+),score=49.24 TRINITY_DN2470_c0_g1_i13:148-582(+)
MDADNRLAAIEAARNAVKYTWTGIMDFLQEQYQSSVQRDTEWILEKQELQSKVASFEGQIRAQSNINRDLLKRIQVLEHSLKRERSRGSAFVTFEENKEKVEDDKTKDDNEEISKELKTEEEIAEIAKKQAEKHREMIKKYYSS